ncbi:MAG: DMT family transporter, partial [Phycisphaeraceae bacterium]|nr:DMT family transporter [Phycisphaeraceae bacterium]
MKNQRLAMTYGLATVLCWSTVASAFKLSLRYLSPVELLFYAVLVSLAVLFAILLLQGKLGELKRLNKVDLQVSLGFGLLNPFLYYLVLFEAYDLLPAQQAQPLNYTWAITLSLLSIPLLKQKISVR